MRSIACLLLVLALASISYGANSFWGYRNSSDKLLLRENVVLRAIRNGQQNQNVEFPKWGQKNSKTISAIFVYDRFTNSSGAIGTLWSGGPGWRFATVNLRSQYNYGINSTVEIYGKR